MTFLCVFLLTLNIRSCWTLRCDVFFAPVESHGRLFGAPCTPKIGRVVPVAFGTELRIS